MSRTDSFDTKVVEHAEKTRTCTRSVLSQKDIKAEHSYVVNGLWRLKREGSDFFPGLKNMSGCPLVLGKVRTASKNLTKEEKVINIDDEVSSETLLRLEYKSFGETAMQYISSMHVSKNSDVAIQSNEYHIGALSVESSKIGAVTIGIIQEYDPNMQYFSIFRCGK